jgi:formylglycine-generating enzyme
MKPKHTSWRLRALLASAALSSACTGDFTSYHLEASDGAGGTSTGGNATAGSATTGSAGGERDTGGTSFGSATSVSGGAAAENAGETGSAGASAAPEGGAAGSDIGPTPVAQPSCVGLADTCGVDSASSCCAAGAIPAGTYNRSNRVADPATLSAFSLDSYEISVGRFRKFVAAYSQTMIPAGAGKNPNNAVLDPGWSVAWNANLPATSGALSTALQCPSGTFTAAVGNNESLPVTCVSWYEAFAFCVWDGGRLPTEAEWNYAAAAGSEERVYPWGSTTPDDSLAVFCPGSCGKMQTVGSRVAGNGKWGQADLVGNAWEWNLDVFVNPYPQTSCTDCANTSYTTGLQRVFRGASAGNDATYLLSATRNSRDPSDHNGFVGARCARNPSSGGI